MRTRLDRNTDRRITAAGLAVAGAFLVASLASLALPDGARLAGWLPLHLALAGGAGVAIGSAMPFFSTALSAAPPAPPSLRIATIGLLAAGATGIATRVVGGAAYVPAVGGLAYVAGAVLLARVSFLPLREARGPRRPLVTLAYRVAIAEVVTGAAIATLFVGGWLPVLGAWGTLKPAHAWLNLFGFASLVITGTLVHLLPTVLGGRIVARRSATLAVRGLAIGPPLVAGGFLVAGDALADVVARTGAAVTLGAAAGLLVFGWDAVRSRGRWTTDPGWHHLTGGGLLAAIGWFGLAATIASGRVLVSGAAPAGWQVGDVAAPLVLGWVAQAIVASAAHLLPTIGPGDPAAHARQRRLLGIGGELRLAGLNGGTALLALGLPTGATGLVTSGAVVAAIAIGSSAVLAGSALVVGWKVPVPDGR